MRPRPRNTLLAVVATLAVALALALVLLGISHNGATSPTPPAQRAPGSSAGESSSGFDGAALPANLVPRDFTLTELLSGRQVALRQYAGQVVILAFPYSTCAAPCTLLAQQIRGALDELPRPVPVLFVSADPGADSPARVARFLANVSLTGRVRYLTGSAAQLRAVWRSYGVAPASAGRAAYRRRIAVFVLDRRGSERVVFGLEQLTPEGLAHDICKLSENCA